MRRIPMLAPCAALCLPSPVLAGETAEGPIIVSSSRSGEEIEPRDYAGSVTVLTADQLERRQARDITDALRDVPGVAVSAVPGQGQLRLRGSEANHVLVLIDGIEVSDPFAGEFDMGTLQAAIGASVEVLRGPQSALYGSDAIGGVIAYRGADGCERAGTSAYVEGGSHASFNAAARAGLCGAGHALAIDASFVSSEGVPNARGGTRDLGREGRTFAARGSVELSPMASLRAVARYALNEGDFNDQDFDPASPTLGLVIDSPGVRFEDEAMHALAGLRLAAPGGHWTHDWSVQFADVQRDSFAGTQRTFGSKGQRIKGSYAGSLQFDGAGLAHRLTLAADWERESFRNTDPFGFAFTGVRRTRNFGLVGEYAARGEGFDLRAAARRDDNNRFADATTYRLAGGVEPLRGTRLHAAWGSGIKNPGFYELYGFVDGRFIGNPDLRPEKSRGWEAGIDQAIAGDALQLAATWFDSTLKDEIFTRFPPPDFLATPGNRMTRSQQQGLELSAHARFGSAFTLDAAYSWLKAREDGVKEVRRPGNLASAVLSWTAPGDAGSATLTLRHNGASDDLAFTDPGFIPVTARLEAYTLVNLAAEARLAGRLRLFARVENLLGERYEQVFSFVSQARSAIVGVRAGF